MNYELCEQLKKDIISNPIHAKDYLKIVTEALEEYEKKVKEDRDSIAYNALSFSNQYFQNSKDKSIQKMKVPMLIDAMYYMFPKGITTQAQADRVIFVDFIETTIKENYLTEHKNWLVDAKGYSYYSWLEEMIKKHKEE
jgi:hypothetical protein